MGELTETPTDKFWIQEFLGNFILKESDLTYDIEALCIKLGDEIAKKIFGGLELYHKLLASIPSIYPYAGVDAEVKISRKDFEKFVNSVRNNEVSNKLLYYFDCANVLGTLQNGVLESKYLVGQFYKVLNLNSFLADENVTVVADGVQFAAGPIVTNITSLTNHIFINLYSQLDFVTKLVYELENLQTVFTSYPRLKSKDVLYGDAKRTSIIGLPNSLFVLDEDIRKIISLRNEIVHNSSIDSIPKVYQVLKGKTVVEKFILLPDFENGFIKTFKNRKRFFDDDTKLNEILPDLIVNFWRRLKVTLDAIK